MLGAAALLVVGAAAAGNSLSVAQTIVPAVSSALKSRQATTSCQLAVARP